MTKTTTSKEQKSGGARNGASTPAKLLISDAKIQNSEQPTKQIEKIFLRFRYTIGTTKDAHLSTGIPRENITRYVRVLEDEGLLQAVYVGRDQHTHRKAKHYSADPAVWEKYKKSPALVEGSLFNEKDF